MAQADVAPTPDKSDESSTTGVPVLLVGTDDWAQAQSAAALTDAGHTVMRCHEPGRPHFPCNAFVAGRGCPLDQGAQLVISSRARPLRSLAPSEMGVVCALHAGLPLLLAGVTPGAPFAPWAAATVPPGGDLGEAVDQVLDREHDVITIPEARTP